MAVEIYSIVLDFPANSDVNSRCLSRYVRADPQISTPLVNGECVVVNGDVVTFDFTSVISGVEKTALDAIVAGYTLCGGPGAGGGPTPSMSVGGSLTANFEDLNKPFSETASSNWTWIGSMPFPGTGVWGTPAQARLTAWLNNNNGGAQMQIRLVTPTGGAVVGTSAAFNHTDPTTHVIISPLSGLPAGPTNIGVEGRRVSGSSGKKLMVASLTLEK